MQVSTLWSAETFNQLLIDAASFETCTRIRDTSRPSAFCVGVADDGDVEAFYVQRRAGDLAGYVLAAGASTYGLYALRPESDADSYFELSDILVQTPIHAGTFADMLQKLRILAEAL